MERFLGVQVFQYVIFSHRSSPKQSVGDVAPSE